MSKQEWFYQVMGQTFGPVAADQLKSLAASGNVMPDTFVRRGANGNWTSADKIGGLFPSPATPKNVATVPSDDDDIVDLLAPSNQAPHSSPSPAPSQGRNATSRINAQKSNILAHRSIQQEFEDGPQYRFLRRVMTIVNVVACLYLLGGGLGFLLMLVQEQLLLAFSCLIGGLTTGGSLLLFSSLVNVFLDLEKNTRKTNALLGAVVPRLAEQHESQ